MGPTRRAAATATTPGPVATSSTRSPLCAGTISSSAAVWAAVLGAASSA